MEMTKEKIQAQAGQLMRLAIAVRGHIGWLTRYSAQAEIVPLQSLVEQADQEVGNIEAAIKRYREGSPQKFEEAEELGSTTD